MNKHEWWRIGACWVLDNPQRAGDLGTDGQGTKYSQNTGGCNSQSTILRLTVRPSYKADEFIGVIKNYEYFA